jgi:hypothetical protein
VLNAAVADRRYRMGDDAFQHNICSLQYRLLNLRYTLDSLLAELVRLTLLAFLSSLYQILGDIRIRLRFPYLADRLGECLRAVDAESDDDTRHVLLWAMMIAATSVYDKPDWRGWLGTKWRASGGEQLLGSEWDDVKSKLEDVMWVAFMHDDPGRAAFAVLSRSVDGEGAEG